MATTATHEPSWCPSGMRSAISRPTGAPAMASSGREPWFVRTSTPTVNPSTTREDVPMPPLKSKHCIPTPAPTEPSATGPGRAPSRAAATCSSARGKERTSFRNESSHSETTGMISRAARGSTPATHRSAAS